MRWNVLLAVLVVAVFYSNNLCAQQADDNKFYVGVGGSYVDEDFDVSGFDDSWGGNVKIGYSFHPLGDIEFVFDYLDSFDYAESYEFDIRTYMVAVKGGFPIPRERGKLSVVVGAGLMTADAEASLDDTDFCGKVGLGYDVFVTPAISIGVEGNYTIGFSDLEDIGYFQYSLGAAFHF